YAGEMGALASALADVKLLAMNRELSSGSRDVTAHIRKQKEGEDTVTMTAIPDVTLEQTSPQTARGIHATALTRSRIQHNDRPIRSWRCRSGRHPARAYGAGPDHQARAGTGRSGQAGWRCDMGYVREKISRL